MSAWSCLHAHVWFILRCTGHKSAAGKSLAVRCAVARCAIIRARLQRACWLWTDPAWRYPGMVWPGQPCSDCGMVCSYALQPDAHQQHLCMHDSKMHVVQPAPARHPKVRSASSEQSNECDGWLTTPCSLLQLCRSLCGDISVLSTKFHMASTTAYASAEARQPSMLPLCCMLVQHSKPRTSVRCSWPTTPAALLSSAFQSTCGLSTGLAHWRCV